MTQLETDSSYVQRGVVRPDVDPDSAAWWRAVADGRFLLPFCAACERFNFPPGPQCDACGNGNVTLTDAPTGGRLYSWIVVHHAQDPAFVDDTPYTVVAVALDAGPRLFGRLLSGTPEADMRVRAKTYHAGDTVLVGFDGSEG